MKNNIIKSVYKYGIASLEIYIFCCFEFATFAFEYRENNIKLWVREDKMITLIALQLKLWPYYISLTLMVCISGVVVVVETTISFVTEQTEKT